MSLSFVKSAVLSSTDGISHNEETSINNPETTSLRSRSTSAKPLFEQLRANKEAADEAQEEFQRSLRGTALLDDEDCAHLDAVTRVREEREMEVKCGIEREVALFRARREDRGLVQSVVGDGDGAEDAETDETAKEKTQKKESKKPIVPKFTIKKKKRKSGAESNGEEEKPAKSLKTSQDKIDKKDTSGNNETNADKAASANTGDSNSGNVTGLLGLGCYGSDSEDD